MGNGEWGTGNREWRTENGEWRMGNGEWGMGESVGASHSVLLSRVGPTVRYRMQRPTLTRNLDPPCSDAGCAFATLGALHSGSISWLIAQRRAECDAPTSGWGPETPNATPNPGAKSRSMPAPYAGCVFVISGENGEWGTGNGERGNRGVFRGLTCLKLCKSWQRI